MRKEGGKFILHKSPPSPNPLQGGLEAYLIATLDELALCGKGTDVGSLSELVGLTVLKSDVYSALW